MRSVLPVEMTPFVGRLDDVGELSRLVTLCGTGEIGKTRLALRAAQEAWFEFERDGGLVSVVEKVKLGQSVSGEVVFKTADGLTRAPTMMSASALADWFAERLEPTGVQVAQETVVERANLPIEGWYSAGKVAELWDVEVEEVSGIAELHAVRREMFTPRTGALHGINQDVLLYNPDEVHIAR